VNSGENSETAVETLIQEAPAFARPICEALRAAIRRAAPDLRECIKWGNPCYQGRGIVCGFAAFQKHVRLFFFKGARLPDPDGLFADGEANASGRSVRFSSLKEIPWKKLERLIHAAAKLDTEGTAKSMQRTRRPELPMPKEFAATLKRSPKARAYFETLPPSCRREYIEWISTAKRDETRERRLAEAIEKLSEGRRHNEQNR
jgi:uncharacterized protein YdeI (YjbR/CyaY-like superfamily)